MVRHSHDRQMICTFNADEWPHAQAKNYDEASCGCVPGRSATPAASTPHSRDTWVFWKQSETGRDVDGQKEASAIQIQIGDNGLKSGTVT